MPDFGDFCLTPCARSGRPGRAACCGLGLASQCLGDQLGHGLILDRAGPAGTHLIVEPLDLVGDEALAPFADRVWADAKPRRHNGVAGLALAGQYDLCRNVRAAGSERERVIAKRCARSSLDVVSSAFARPLRIGYLLRSGYPKPM